MRAWGAVRACVALVGSLVFAAAPSVARADPVVEGIFQDARYRFCHEDDYPLTPDEHAWCPLIGEVSAACPSLPAACKLPPVAPADMLLGRRRRPSHDTGAPVETPSEDTRARPKTIVVPGLSSVAQALLVLLVVAFLVVLGRALAANIVRGHRGEAPPDDAPPGDPTPEGAPVRGPIETDVERLLERARAAAARGEHARAVDDAYAALLRRLDGDGLIEIHPSRTNGDYIRDLRERVELRGAVRGIVRDVERVQFGDTPASERTSREVLERVVPLVARALSALLLCFGSSAVLSCVPHVEAGSADAPTSPSGRQAVVELLGERGVEVKRRAEPLGKLAGPTTVVLLPGVQPDDATWEHLLAWVQDQGGRLILAGAHPLPAGVGVKLVQGTSQGTAVRVDFQYVGTYGDLSLAIPEGPGLEPVSGEEVEGALLHRKEAVYASLRSVGEGKLAVLADDRLFTNAALLAVDDAALLTRLVQGMPEPAELELCDEWTGIGATTPLQSLDRAHLTPLIVQLFALLGLFCLWKGKAFARLRDPPSEARRAFADHVRALGLAYSRARASRHVLGLYAAWAMERLRERVHRTGGQGLIPLAEVIAARTGRSEAEVMRVLVEAGGARDEAAPPSSLRPTGARPAPRARRAEVEADLALMHELWGLLSAMGGRTPARRARSRTA